MHLLVIEDEPALCNAIAEGLRLDGYEVDTCQDGVQALELCYVENYDLILLDLNLPGMDGMEVHVGGAVLPVSYPRRKAFADAMAKYMERGKQ